MRTAKQGGLVLLAALVVIQFIPVSKTNPAVTREVRWNAPATRTLAQRSCFDCHSNETRFPWWVHIAPGSFLMASDVSDGRSHLNFSEWDKPQRARIDDVDKEVRGGDMPIWEYVLLHPGTRLSDAEKTQLIDGLRATFMEDPPIPSHGKP